MQPCEVNKSVEQIILKELTKRSLIFEITKDQNSVSLLKRFGESCREGFFLDREIFKDVKHGKPLILKHQSNVLNLSSGLQFY